MRRATYASSARNRNCPLSAPTDRYGGKSPPVRQPLTGDLKGLWRYRVGDYRMVAAIEEDRFVVLVVTVGHRREVYD